MAEPLNVKDIVRVHWHIGQKCFYLNVFAFANLSYAAASNSEI
jgi:hypothetical protein